MKNLLTIASAVVLVISIAACKKEKQNVINNPTPNTPVPDTTIRLVRIYWETKHTVKLQPETDVIAHSIDFEYDMDGLVSKVTSKMQLIQHNTTNSYNPEWSVTETVFVRGSNKKTIREDNIYTSDKYQVNYSRNYTYYSSYELFKVAQAGQPAAMYEWTHGRLTVIQEPGGSKRTLTYDVHGNVQDMRSVHLINNGKDTALYIDRTDIQYDNNPNYVQSIKGLDCPISIFGYNPQTFSKNNVTGYFVPRGANDSLVFEAVSLEYNSDGYVSKDAASGTIYTYEKVAQ